MGEKSNEDTVPVFNFQHMYALDCFPALQCKREPKLAMFCRVMVHLHISVHCAFTKGCRICFGSFLEHIWRPRRRLLIPFLYLRA